MAKENTLKQINFMVVYEKDLGIAFKEKFPWPKLPIDFHHMKTSTKFVKDSNKRNALIIGKRTWFIDANIIQALWPSEYKIVISRKLKEDENADYICPSVSDAMKHLSLEPLCQQIENVWNLGGSIPYAQAIESDYPCRIYATEIEEPFECDTFFPALNWDEWVSVTEDHLVKNWDRVEENGAHYRFKIYTRK